MRVLKHIAIASVLLPAFVAMENETMAYNAGEGSLMAVIVTDKGDIWLELYPEEAPLTVSNFVNLAQRGYYDSLTFHRVIANFMIQGGDPTGTGSGGPGYKFKDEFAPNRKHDTPGILSMANAGAGTNGSQFFITHVPTPHLDDKRPQSGHTVFGKVLKGQDVVDSIAKGDAMKAVVILGDTSKLFEAQKAQLEEWNAKLDEGFPAKESAASQEKVEELKSQLPEIEAAAAAEAEAAAQAKAAKAARFNELYEKAKAEGTETESGVVIYDVTEGTGPMPTEGQMVTVHTTGWMTDGTQFYSTHDGGKPIQNLVGKFVPGYNEALTSMKEGGTRVIIVPGRLGYPKGKPEAKIPPDTTLVFEIELLPSDQG
jgi:cyclophilin family peptidyl-prolyl cis-trans isomerase